MLNNAGRQDFRGSPPVTSGARTARASAARQKQYSVVEKQTFLLAVAVNRLVIASAVSAERTSHSRVF